MPKWLLSKQMRYALQAIGVVAAAILLWQAAQPMIIQGFFLERINDLPQKVCATRPDCKSIKVRPEYDSVAHRWTPVLELQITGYHVSVADGQQLARQFIEAASTKMWIMRFYADEFVVRANGVRIPLRGK